MQASFGEMLALLIKNGCSDKICFLGELQSNLIFPPVNNDSLFWRCSRVYMSKLVSKPRDAWNNDSGKSNFLAEAGGDLRCQVHGGSLPVAAEVAGWLICLLEPFRVDLNLVGFW